MKKIGLFFIAIIFGTAVSMAQPGGQGQRNMNPEERAKTQTAQLKELLGLNQAQEKKVYDLNLEQGKQRTKMFEEMQNGGGDREAMREKMTAMNDEMNKKMKEILTAEQWTKYEKWQEERRANRGQRGGGGGGR